MSPEEIVKMVPSLHGLRLTNADIGAVAKHYALVRSVRQKCANAGARVEVYDENVVWSFVFPDGPYREEDRPKHESVNMASEACRWANLQLARDVARQLGAAQAAFEVRCRLDERFLDAASQTEAEGVILEHNLGCLCGPVAPLSTGWVFDVSRFCFRRPTTDEVGVSFAEVYEAWTQSTEVKSVEPTVAAIPEGGGLKRWISTWDSSRTRSYPSGPGMVNHGKYTPHAAKVLLPSGWAAFISA